jgi:hypothetical protein
MERLALNCAGDQLWDSISSDLWSEVSDCCEKAKPTIHSMSASDLFYLITIKMKKKLQQPIKTVDSEVSSLLTNNCVCNKPF